MAFWRQHQERIECEQWAEWIDGDHHFKAGEIKADKDMSEEERLLRKLLKHFFVSKWHGGLLWDYREEMVIKYFDDNLEKELIPYLEADKADELRKIHGIGE